MSCLRYSRLAEYLDRYLHFPNLIVECATLATIAKLSDDPLILFADRIVIIGVVYSYFNFSFV
jgi:hypothetical protein